MVMAMVIGAAALPAAGQGVTGVASTHSVTEADARLAGVARQRAAVEAKFSDSERSCYTQFFVNHCLDQAKEKRRAALTSLRAIEVEASHFKRADAVAKRDQVLAEQDAKEQTAAKKK